eukprot:SAG11_NODE_20502_length_444_cov_0.518841_1_plen_26_part_01
MLYMTGAARKATDTRPDECDNKYAIA